MDRRAPNPAETYERYLVPNLFVPWTAELVRRADPRPGERVLDVACGTGVVSRAVARLVQPGGSVVGLDLSPAMLEVARDSTDERLPIEWREASAVDLPFGPGAFELVLCQQGLQFFPDRARAVQEMRRVVVDGGRAVVALWRGLEYHPLYQALSDAAGRHLGKPFTQPFSLGDADQLRTLFAGAGFRSIDVEAVGLTVRFPSPERWIDLSVRGAAAVIPEFAQMDEATRDGIVAAISRDLAGVVREHTDGDLLVVPMHSHLARAVA